MAETTTNAQARQWQPEPDYKVHQVKFITNLGTLEIIATALEATNVALEHTKREIPQLPGKWNYLAEQLKDIAPKLTEAVAKLKADFAKQEGRKALTMFEVKQDEVPALNLSDSELDLISRMVEAGWVMKMRPRAVELLVEQLLGHIAAQEVELGQEQATTSECDKLRQELERSSDRRYELAANLIELHRLVPGNPVYVDGERTVRLVKDYVELLRSRVVSLMTTETCICGHVAHWHNMRCAWSRCSCKGYEGIGQPQPTTLA